MNVKAYRGASTKQSDWNEERCQIPGAPERWLSKFLIKLRPANRLKNTSTEESIDESVMTERKEIH